MKTSPFYCLYQMHENEREYLFGSFDKKRVIDKFKELDKENLDDLYQITKEHLLLQNY